MFHCTKKMSEDQHNEMLKLYLVRREEQYIRARRVHLVTLTRVNSLLLDSLNLEWLEFLVEHLTLGMTRMSILGAIY